MKFKRSFHLLLLVILSATNNNYSYAKTTNFAVSTIPQDLIVQSDVVIRNEKIIVEMVDKNVIEKHQYVITILNEKGNDFAVLRAFYNSFSQVSKIKGILYDKEGKQLQSLKKEKIYDVSTFGSSYTFHDDLRVKIFSFDYKQYPYTVAFEYEVKTDNNFFLPSWSPQVAERVAVEESEFVLGRTKGVKINRKLYNMPASLEQGIYYESTKEFEWWKIKGLKPAIIQTQSDAISSLPLINFVPQNISLGKFKGETDSWLLLGQFIYNMNKGRDALPENIKTKVLSLTENAKSDREKIAILYKYLQENTRYVANEYGLAGWQTFEASEVARLNYGDCKGLSNYMKALLNVVNIPSHLVVINAGEDNTQKVDPNFVSNRFNHMILCVPQSNDTIWLECTSTTNAPGYLGAFTHNRKALILTEEGGYLVQTPQYNKTLSQIDRNVEIWLDINNESSKVLWNTKYTGLMQDDLLTLVKSGSTIKIKERIRKISAYKDVDIDHHKYDQVQELDKNPEVRETFELKVGHLVESMSKRFIVNIPINQSLLENFGSVEKRTLPFVLDRDVQVILQYKIHIPEGYNVEMLSGDFSLIQPFAKLSSTVKQESNLLVIRYLFEQNAGTFNAAVYEDYVQMQNDVKQRLSNIHLSIVKK